MIHAAVFEQKRKIIENNTLYAILVEYALFCSTIPRAFTEDKEGSDVP
jgi:hypothetical protein